MRRLTTETVEGTWRRKSVREDASKDVMRKQEELTALALESVDDVERSDGLALGVLSVGDSVTDDTLKEGLQDTTGLLVDHGGDTLDTTTASETADSGLGDTLDVVAQNLAVTLGAALAETLATLATCEGKAR
jgi:hypothetical protein